MTESTWVVEANLSPVGDIRKEYIKLFEEIIEALKEGELEDLPLVEEAEKKMQYVYQLPTVIFCQTTREPKTIKLEFACFQTITEFEEYLLYLDSKEWQDGKEKENSP